MYAVMVSKLFGQMGYGIAWFSKLTSTLVYM
jgi:hypothetical protein